MRHKRILRKFKIRNIFEVFIVLSILIVSVSSAIVVMTTDPEYSVQFIAGNETYIADAFSKEAYLLCTYGYGTRQ